MQVKLASDIGEKLAAENPAIWGQIMYLSFIWKLEVQVGKFYNINIAALRPAFGRQRQLWDRAPAATSR